MTLSHFRSGLSDGVTFVLILLAFLFVSPVDFFGAEASTEVTTNGVSSLAANTNSSTPTILLSMESLNGQYILKPMDRVSYRVIEDREEPKLLMISTSGEMDVPYLGRVVATNKTCRALAKEIKAMLEKELYYTATVILGTESSSHPIGSVYITGYVRSPGPIELSSDEPLTVGRAILRAGGFAEFANKRKVKVTRPGKNGDASNQTFYVDVNDIWERGKSQSDRVLEPGDQIHVSGKLINL